MLGRIASRFRWETELRITLPIVLGPSMRPRRDHRPRSLSRDVNV